ncbi:hypothetical protein NP493_1193g01021 [Ridgeia piscesae]|uniref:Cytochrome oxidase complex assembly protein 1 n=1 Tax=Ridgeia piscesae TaxID=27915 RepID=A0AAD9KDU7_RIDPI|nr:hypothetical protein NP493_1193g01021 [Ridgeia piscesae]
MVVPLKTLKMIAIGMGPVVLGSGIFFKWRTEQNFMKQGFYEASIKAIMQYPPIVDPLGPPVKFMRVNLGKTGINRTDGVSAHVAIPVTGTKTKGTFYSWCSKEDVYSGWEVDKIDLEINDRRRTVYINPKAKDRYQPTEIDDEELK